MAIKHRVRINVSSGHDSKQTVLESGVRSFPKRFLRALFGEASQVFVLKPGQSVESVEVWEVGNEDVP